MFRLITGSLDPNPIVAGFQNVSPGNENEVRRSEGRKEWAFFLITARAGYFIAGKTTFPAQPGHFYAIEPSIPHHYGSSRAGIGWENHWIHVHPRSAWTPWMRWPEMATGLRRLTLDPTLMETVITRLRDLENEQQSNRRLHSELAMNLFEQVLLLCDEANPLSRDSSRHDSRIRPALDWLDRRYREPMSLEKLARHCGMSRSLFARVFRASTGTTPARYLESQRLERARRLLEFTTDSVTSIAAGVGFSNVYYFSLRFKKQVGQSPLAYRKSGQHQIRNVVA